MKRKAGALCFMLLITKMWDVVVFEVQCHCKRGAVWAGWPVCGYAEGQVLEEWLFLWICSRRSFCSSNVLCLALRESYCRCCSCRKVIWLVRKYTGHGSPLSRVFLPLCIDGTEHGQKHRKEENPCFPLIFHKCIWKKNSHQGSWLCFRIGFL